MAYNVSQVNAPMTLQQFRVAIAHCVDNRPTLDEFLYRVSAISTSASNAVAGIYCGGEGKEITEPIPEYTTSRTMHRIVFNWFTHDTGRIEVEYAYVS